MLLQLPDLGEKRTARSLEVTSSAYPLTGVNQTAGQLQEELADELGCDLVEVSAHAGARPEHAAWQGRIYSRSGDDPKYPDFKKSTGYGTGAGLCGWNCRHTFGPYIEGSPPVWSEEQLAELDKPKYEYGGRKLTEYEASQQQRHNERQIRRWKREEAAMQAGGLDSSEASAKVKEWQGRQQKFLAQTGFKRQHGREQIQKNVFNVTKEYEKNAAPKTGSIIFSDGYSSKHHAEEIHIAEWLHETYGGDITLVAESTDCGEKRPDYIWREKMWELKSPSTEKAVDSAVRSALKQIDKNPGGIVLDFGENIFSIGAVEEAVGNRLARNLEFVVDVILRANDSVVHVLRYDGRKNKRR